MDKFVAICQIILPLVRDKFLHFVERYEWICVIVYHELFYAVSNLLRRLNIAFIAYQIILFHSVWALFLIPTITSITLDYYRKPRNTVEFFRKFGKCTIKRNSPSTANPSTVLRWNCLFFIKFDAYDARCLYIHAYTQTSSHSLSWQQFSVHRAVYCNVGKLLL